MFKFPCTLTSWRFEGGRLLQVWAVIATESVAGEKAASLPRALLVSLRKAAVQGPLTQHRGPVAFI